MSNDALKIVLIRSSYVRKLKDILENNPFLIETEEMDGILCELDSSTSNFRPSTPKTSNFLQQEMETTDHTSDPESFIFTPQTPVTSDLSKQDSKNNKSLSENEYFSDSSASFSATMPLNADYYSQQEKENYKSISYLESFLVPATPSLPQTAQLILHNSASDPETHLTSSASVSVTDQISRGSCICCGDLLIRKPNY